MQSNTPTRAVLEEMCLSIPLLKVFAAALTTLALIVVLEWSAIAPDVRYSMIVVSFVLGLVYTQLFEYGHHRFLMHVRVPGFAFARRSHLRHHAVFHGDNFTTRHREYLNHVAGRWYHFPPALMLHYLVLAPFVPSAYLVAFLAGVVSHYLAFEASHWFAHIEASVLDRAVAQVPVLGAVRYRQIRHHRRHHEHPNEAFNFNPPFIGDCLATVVDEASSSVRTELGSSRLGS